jgi:hypothetical protein
MAAAAVIGLAVPASAHEPVLLDSCDVLPQTGPLIPVGTDPIGFFGVLPQLGSDRALQLTMKAGDQLNVGYGIPDQAPENTLATGDLPIVMIIAPDGTPTFLQPSIRVPLHNPDFDQDYLFLNNYATTAQAGTYSIVMLGRAPERIFMATGVEDSGFHGIERGSLATDQQLTDWYTTSPTAAQPGCGFLGKRAA